MKNKNEQNKAKLRKQHLTYVITKTQMPEKQRKK